MKRILMSMAAVAILASCSTAGAPPAPQLTFDNYAPITMNVASSTVTEEYIQPNDPQDISGQFILSPSEAIKRYAAKRFQANGSGDGFFQIAILDSRVHMQQMDEKNRVLKWSGVGKEDEYRLFLQVRVTPQPSGFSGRPGPTTIKFERTLVMPSSVTVAEREMRQVKFLEKMVADIDAKVQDVFAANPGLRQ